MSSPAPVPPLVARFTRTSPTHHRLELIRADGSREDVALETRSCLFHDLVHFAVEREAGLADGFYGCVARGVTYRDLMHPEDPAQMAGMRDELLAIERVVALLQGAVRSGRTVDPHAFVTRLVGFLADLGEAPPAWLSAAMVERALARLRSVNGHWAATRFGETMELRFDAGS